MCVWLKSLQRHLCASSSAQVLFSSYGICFSARVHCKTHTIYTHGAVFLSLSVCVCLLCVSPSGAQCVCSGTVLPRRICVLGQYEVVQTICRSMTLLSPKAQNTYTERRKKKRQGFCGFLCLRDSFPAAPCIMHNFSLSIYIYYNNICV